MNQPESPSVRRPVPVTVVCAVGLLAALATAILLGFDWPWLVPPSTSQRLVAAVALAVFLAGLAGVWRMRRWGLMIWAGVLVARLGYGLATDTAVPAAPAAGSAVMVIIVAAYWRRMR